MTSTHTAPSPSALTDTIGGPLPDTGPTSVAVEPCADGVGPVHRGTFDAVLVILGAVVAVLLAAAGVRTWRRRLTDGDAGGRCR